MVRTPAMRPARQSLRAGEKIRVLVVDDSVVTRRLLARIIEGDASLELAGVARNGVDALAKVEHLHPDLVTLDVEMPEMDGISALRQMVALYPEVRVIMLSRLGTCTMLEAMLAGASDSIAKPQCCEPTPQTFEMLERELSAKIRQLYDSEPMKLAQPVVPMPSTMLPEIFAIGVSTGGPAALTELLAAIPVGFPLPIAIVQHMPPYFTRLLAERLTKSSTIRIMECEDGMAAEPGCAVIAPGDHHMRLVRSGTRLEYRLSQEQPENSCRPAVDVLFRSVAESCGERAIAAVLTGMGQDGLLGAQQLNARGALLLAQDRASSTVWGMPGAIVKADLADAVLPLRMIVPEVLRRMGYQ